MQNLRRVSFSDSALTEEHFYPKYIYDDYDMVNSDNDGTDSGSKMSTENSGISQRIHPSLLPSNENDRYSPSKIPQMKSGALGQYTPSMTGNYNDMMQSHLSGFGAYENRKTSPAKQKQVQEEPMYNGGPVSDDRANDFYSALNSDTAALLW